MYKWLHDYLPQRFKSKFFEIFHSTSLLCSFPKLHFFWILAHYTSSDKSTLSTHLGSEGVTPPMRDSLGRYLHAPKARAGWKSASYNSYIITQYIQKWDFKNPYHVDVNFYSLLICYACGVETERLRDDKW